MTLRPRYVLDTEALVRAFRSDGPARELVQRAMVRDLSLYTSTTILDELEDVLMRPRFGLTRSEVGEIRRVLLAAADRVEIFVETECSRRWVESDEGDDHVVETAFRTQADILVTSDTGIHASRDLPCEVLTEPRACERYRMGVPYGTSLRLGPDDLRSQSERLAGGSGNLREAVDVELCKVTDDLDFAELASGVRAAALTARRTAELAAELVGSCGVALGVDLRGGGCFDYASGVRYDSGPGDEPVSLDVIWYTADRAQDEAIQRPDAPTIADFGFADDHRLRSVLAGGVVLELPSPTPRVGDVTRLLVLVDEPLAQLPPARNDFRLFRTDEEEARVIAFDPAGTSMSSTCWMAGGPSAILAGSSLPPDLLTISFLLADRAADRAALPVPPPDLLLRRVPGRFRSLVVRS